MNVTYESGGHVLDPAPYHLAWLHARSVAEDRLSVPIGKDRGKVQVRLCAKTEVAAGMGIHRDDRLYPDLEIAAHPDNARIDRAGRPPRERPIEWRRRCEFNQGNPSLRVAGPGTVGTGIHVGDQTVFQRKAQQQDLRVDRLGERGRAGGHRRRTCETAYICAWAIDRA